MEADASNLMRIRGIRVASLIAALFFLHLFAKPALAGVDPLYRLTSIPMPDDATWSEAVSINNRGDVAGGITWLLKRTAGYTWSKRKGLTLLAPSLYSDSTQANDINERGDVTGWTRNVNDEAVASIWLKGQEIRQLGTLGGTSSIGFGLNNSRTVVGASLPNLYATKYQATVWADNDSPFNPDAEIVNRSVAHDVNNRGVVVGDISYLGGTYGFVWSKEYGYYNDRTDYLHDYSRFMAINDHDWITGVTSISRVAHPILAKPSGEVRILETGSYNAEGLGINNHNTIVGRSWTCCGYDTRAMVWDEANGIRDLNHLINQDSGWTLTIAYDINDRGQVVGTGTYEGQTRAFLLTPNPEPSTLLMYITGCTLCIVRSSAARRKENPTVH